MGQLGFFDADKRLAAISAKGDPLEMIDRVVPFESFRAESIVRAAHRDGSRPHLAPVLQGSWDSANIHARSGVIGGILAKIRHLWLQFLKQRDHQCP